jgi:hypothetical protein
MKVERVVVTVALRDRNSQRDAEDNPPKSMDEIKKLEGYVDMLYGENTVEGFRTKLRQALLEKPGMFNNPLFVFFVEGQFYGVATADWEVVKFFESNL